MCQTNYQERIKLFLSSLSVHQSIGSYLYVSCASMISIQSFFTFKCSHIQISKKLSHMIRSWFMPLFFYKGPWSLLVQILCISFRFLLFDYLSSAVLPHHPYILSTSKMDTIESSVNADVLPFHPYVFSTAKMDSIESSVNASHLCDGFSPVFFLIYA